SIQKRCFRRAQELGFASIELKPEAEAWLAAKFANEDKSSGFYGKLNDILDRAIARAQERPCADDLEVTLDDVIGPPPPKGSVSGFRKDVAARKPPLFGLDAQID